jgi:chromosome segregation protein
MKLRRLRLHGFKSFADRTEITFHEGITAVVGPNGCGKSNISDAIRWVLGEQRASAIRGARMEEAIFQGTTQRRPVNRGSVALGVSNEDGVLPVPYAEVEISRTVFRDGGSEYTLNKAACRLRDIQDLYRDTGLGANAYAIIEGRMVDAILSERADERRALFEEAAGIGKYKDRRKAASRRLERAEIDLQRVEDLLLEVESKVRSLARQKGKAERWKSLRTQRLDLEVGLARRQLETLQARRVAIEDQLSTDRDQEASRASQLQGSEAQLEALRLNLVTLERQRGDAGKALEEVTLQLSRWEREMAVADTRRENAGQRLGQIQGERQDAAEARTESEHGLSGLTDARAMVEEGLASLSKQVTEARQRRDAAQAALQAARQGLEREQAQDRAFQQDLARKRGELESALNRIEELAQRSLLLEDEHLRAQEALQDLDAQGDLFSDRVSRLETGVTEAEKIWSERAAAIDPLREQVRTQQRQESQRREALAQHTGRQRALERIVHDMEGVAPVVRALLRAGLSGVEGLITDFIQTPVDLATPVERLLGPLSLAVVVRDQAAVRDVLGWFESTWKKGGGLVLLPLDAVPERSGGGAEPPFPPGALLAAVTLRGVGAPWVRTLLSGFAFSEPAAGPEGVPAGGRGTVSGDGRIVRREGEVHLGNPSGASGVLERKEQLRILARERQEAEAALADASAHREAMEQTLSEAEAAREAARLALRQAEDLHREARAQAHARSERREALVRQLRDLGAQIDQVSTTRERTLARKAELEEGMRAVEDQRRAWLEAFRLAKEGLEVAEVRWEEAREASSILEVEQTRLQGEERRLRERELELAQRRVRATQRLEGLADEETRLREAVKLAEDVREAGRLALEGLFGDREKAEARRRAVEEKWEETQTAVQQGERTVREQRARERDAADARHRLELEGQEIFGNIGRIQERLEGEWGRSLQALLKEAQPVEGTEEELRQASQDVGVALERLGPVNQLAVEEHQEEEARLLFLKSQHEDLIKARNDLRAAIREINLTATRLFETTFQQIREHFRTTFLRLFQGGECDLWLTDPEDPLDSPIEIQASPRGKRTQRIDLLSGGERALTALSLLFGIYLVKPSPFCVLDEVDAPLDESNIGRFIHLLQEFKAQTQFVVITHNPRTIEAADWIYGVTMEEPGVSRIVGVRLEEALEVAGGDGLAGPSA